MGQVFNLSCKSEIFCRDSDAGADVFLFSSLEGYNELCAAFKLCKHRQRQTRLVQHHWSLIIHRPCCRMCPGCVARCSAPSNSAQRGHEDHDHTHGNSKHCLSEPCYSSLAWKSSSYSNLVLNENAHYIEIWVRTCTETCQKDSNHKNTGLYLSNSTACLWDVSMDLAATSHTFSYKFCIRQRAFKCCATT